jgi:gluconokinase
VMTTAPGPPPRGLWRYRLDRRLAIVGGALSEGGNLLAWCREVLRLPEDAAIEAAIAALPADGHGLTVLPFIAGERAPGWRGDRRATITGVRLDTTATHIVRAMLEAVALRLGIVHELLAPWASSDHAVLASGGGVAHARIWAQIISDVLGRPITVLRDEEATSRGAALLALSALGVRPELASAQPPDGETLRPDAARHAHYREALARQRALDAKLA